MASRLTGASAFTGSSGAFGFVITRKLKFEFVKSSVLPSVGPLATASVPMRLPAPGRFSMTMVCPSALVMRSAMKRLTWSVTPPGG